MIEEEADSTYRLAKAIHDSWKIQGFDTSQTDVCLPYRGRDSAIHSAAWTTHWETGRNSPQNPGSRYGRKEMYQDLSTGFYHHVPSGEYVALKYAILLYLSCRPINTVKFSINILSYSDEQHDYVIHWQLYLKLITLQGSSKAVPRLQRYFL
jgi:hypothetical protein